MDEVTLVRDTLRSHWRWHGGRLSLVSIFLIALLRARTVNWSELATAFCGKAQMESHYQRLNASFGSTRWTKSPPSNSSRSAGNSPASLA